MRRHLSVGAIAALSLPVLAEPTGIFYDDFQRNPRPEWSNNLIHETTGPRIFTWYAGRFNRETIHLTLDAVELSQVGDLIEPFGQGQGGGGGDGDGGDGGGGGENAFIQYTLTFDLYIIDSWDGNYRIHGPDTFEVLANGRSIFYETFANQHEYQTFREPDIGRSHMGYNEGARDSIYRAISIPFTIDENDPRLRLSFRAIGLQGIQDESWGIDNVGVAYEIVPAPASLAPISIAALALRRRRR